MLRQIVLHTFSSGIYTVPFPSCLQLHIYTALSPPPTVLQRSRQLICWPSSETAPIAGQRMAAKTNSYKNVAVCVCLSAEVLCPFFPIQPTPSFKHMSCIFTVHPDIMESVCLWNLQMKCTCISSTLRGFQTSESLQNAGCKRVPGSSLHDLNAWCHRCFYVLYTLSQSAQFTEFYKQSLKFCHYLIE